MTGSLWTAQTAKLGTQGVALTETSGPIYAQAVEGIAAFDPTGIGDISVNSSGSSANPSNLTIQNNIIENLSYQGVDIGWKTDSTATSGSTISHNLFQNIGAYNDEGDAVRLYNNFYATVDSNQIINARMGIEQGNYGQPDPGITGSIANNDIQARRRGIFYNLTHSSAVNGLPVTGNTITATADDLTLGGSVWVGVYLISQQGTITSPFLNNNIDGSGSNYTSKAGFAVAAVDSTASVSITGGTISNVTYGIWEDNNDPNGFTSSAVDESLTISGVTISAASAGIYVHDTSATLGVAATITGGSITATGANGVGILISGAHASASISNVTIDGDQIGVDVNGGSATISGNHIFNNITGIRLNASGTASVTGNDFTGATDNTTDLQLRTTAGLLSAAPRQCLRGRYVFH